MDDPIETGEIVEHLLQRPGVRIERIESRGHATPPGRCYDQAEDEWVMLVEGAARLWMEDRGTIHLSPGDHVLIPAHCRHRVEWTDPDARTVWLAVFMPPSSAD